MALSLSCGCMDLSDCIVAVLDVRHGCGANQNLFVPLGTADAMCVSVFCLVFRQDHAKTKKRCAFCCLDRGVAASGTRLIPPVSRIAACHGPCVFACLGLSCLGCQSRSVFWCLSYHPKNRLLKNRQKHRLKAIGLHILYCSYRGGSYEAIQYSRPSPPGNHQFV